MNRFKAQKDECFILVKALPHRSSKYYETVCCAGIGRDGKWRRQYPVPYRILADSQKFGRWQWIEYEFTTSKDDKRRESQKVDPESLVVGKKLKESDRSKILNPLVVDSFRQADLQGDSLTLLRPQSLELRYNVKSQAELSGEREKHAKLANQLSFFDKTAKPLEPCPVQFNLRWKDSDGTIRNHECDDWETSATYIRFLRQQGHDGAIEYLKQTYENKYLKDGMVLAFSTHKRRNLINSDTNQWLLVGIIRLDESPQGDFLLTAGSP